jgi:ATP-dependent protease ClpP protease subunit
MKAIILLFAMSIIGVFPAFAGEVVHMTGPRTLRVAGEIGPGALKMVSTIEEMSAQSALPINIVINSPGGSVLAGLQIVEAIHIAQQRGVVVRCAVTNLAASMAFIILAECDERYALANSLLLFHPARAMIMFAALKAEDARYMAEELESINEQVCSRLEESMGVATSAQKKWFDYHFKNETLWTASRLLRHVPQRGWLTIVSDIKTSGKLFNSIDGGDEQAAVRNFLQNRGAQ